MRYPEPKFCQIVKMTEHVQASKTKAMLYTAPSHHKNQQLKLQIHKLSDIDISSTKTPTCINIKGTKMYPFWRFPLYFNAFNALLQIQWKLKFFLSHKNKLIFRHFYANSYLFSSSYFIKSMF